MRVIGECRVCESLASVECASHWRVASVRVNGESRVCKSLASIFARLKYSHRRGTDLLCVSLMNYCAFEVVVIDIII